MLGIVLAFSSCSERTFIILYFYSWHLCRGQRKMPVQQPGQLLPAWLPNGFTQYKASYDPTPVANIHFSMLFSHAFLCSAHILRRLEHEGSTGTISECRTTAAATVIPQTVQLMQHQKTPVDQAKCPSNLFLNVINQMLEATHLNFNLTPGEVNSSDATVHLLMNLMGCCHH